MPPLLELLLQDLCLFPFLQIIGCRVIPWVKANLNYTAQALLISSGTTFPFLHRQDFPNSTQLDFLNIMIEGEGNKKGEVDRRKGNGKWEILNMQWRRLHLT